MRFLLLLTLAALPAPALAAETSAFTRQCETKAPTATCSCIAAELQKSRDGQVVLDTYQAAGLPEAERKAATAAMLERYKLTPADLGPIGNAVPTMLDAARKACP